RRQPIFRGEESESAVAVTGQSSVESDPDVARAVFGERAGDIVFRRGEVRCRAQVVQALIARLPENETVAVGIEGRTPYSAFRVFENAKDLRRGVCAFCSIDCEWSRFDELGEVISGGKVVKLSVHRHP